MLPPKRRSVFERRPGLALVFIFVALVVLFIASISLPENRYIRFQKLEQTTVGRSRWDYERINFDPAPIDVAVVGDSRTEAAISAPLLAAALSRSVGHQVHVANLSIPQAGRNLDYVIVKELLAKRPEVRIILLSMSAISSWSHPAFKQLADPQDVVRSPIFVNYFYLDDVSALPYRSLALFMDGVVPAISGYASNFDHGHYQGTDYDTSRSFYEPDGHFINREKLSSAAALDRELADQPPVKLTLSRRLLGKREDVVDEVFVRRIATLAASKGVELLLIHIPRWRQHAPEFDAAAMSKVAPILFAPDSIADHAEYFGDFEHLNERGIQQVSSWIVPTLQPFLGPLQRVPGNRPSRATEGTTSQTEPSQ